MHLIDQLTPDCPGCSGGLGDILGGGEDFLGLRELGIEAEFGLKSLSIPKRLWKGKTTAEDRTAPDRCVHRYDPDLRNNIATFSANAGEPPPPFPPPPAFIPLEPHKVDSQIGLLKNFYQERFTALAMSSAPAPPPDVIATNLPIMPAIPLPAPSSLAASASGPLIPLLSVPLVLPDDSPNPSRTKIGPLGQVIVTNPTTGNKKKGKTKESVPDKSKDNNAEATPALKKETKKKKGKHEQMSGAMDVDGQPANGEVNAAVLKKKPKGGGSGKKSVKNTKLPLDVPPAIIASA